MQETEWNDAEDQQANKYHRFDLKSNDLGNSWTLPSGQATYVNKSSKDIKENIISVTPVPSKIKDSQKLDKYFKKLLTENKKTIH